MSTPLQREGTQLDDLMREIYAEHGDVHVNNVERVRTGGVGGFFAREVFRVTFTPGTTYDAGNTLAQRLAQTSDDDPILPPILTRNAPASGSPAQAVNHQPGSTNQPPTRGVESPHFSAVMESLHHAVGLTEPAGRVLDDDSRFTPFHPGTPPAQPGTANSAPTVSSAAPSPPRLTDQGTIVPPASAHDHHAAQRGAWAAAYAPPTSAPTPAASPTTPPAPTTLNGRPAVTARAQALPADEFLRIGIPDTHVSAALTLAGHTGVTRQRDGTINVPTLTMSTLLETVPTAPPPPYDNDAIIAVVGPSHQCIHVAQELARDLGLDDKDIATAGRHESVVRFGPLVLTAKSARDLRAHARVDETPVVVAVGIGNDATDWYRAKKILEAFDPDYTCAVALADQDIAGTRRWVEEITQEVSIDALHVWHMRQAATPGAILHLRIPVARIDGYPADSVVWGAALSQALPPVLWDERAVSG